LRKTGRRGREPRRVQAYHISSRKTITLWLIRKRKGKKKHGAKTKQGRKEADVFKSTVCESQVRITLSGRK